MSNIYTDDNIHEALEKVAGLPGYMKKNLSTRTLKRLRAGHYPSVAGKDAKALSKGEYPADRLAAAYFDKYRSGRRAAKHIAKARKSSGNASLQGRDVGKAYPEILTGKNIKKDMGAIGSLGVYPKVKVASDDNIHDALEKVAMSDSTKSLMALPFAAGTAGAGIYGLSGATRKGSAPLAKRLMRGGATGGAIGLAVSSLVGIGNLLNKADPSGKSLEAAVKLAPAVLTVAGAVGDTKDY